MMNRQKVSRELTAVAKELMSAKMPPGLEHLRLGDWPYAVLVFNKRYVEFRAQMDEAGEDVRTGTEPYGNNAPKAIMKVISLLKRMGIDEKNIEVL